MYFYFNKYCNLLLFKIDYIVVFLLLKLKSQNIFFSYKKGIEKVSSVESKRIHYAAPMIVILYHYY